jgi:hypothetical protein
MANILNLITNGEKQYYIVDADPAAGAGTPAPVASIASYDAGPGTTGSLYVKVGPLDVDWDKVSTMASSGVGLGTYLRLPIYDLSPNGYHIDDTVAQNGNNIDIAVQAQPSRSAAIEYRIPNPGNAITAADFILSEGAQTKNGNMTFNDDVIVQGNLTVNGALTYLHTTNTQITDALITLNKGGTTASAAGSGFEIEGTAAAVVGYFKVAANSNGYELLVPGVSFKNDLDLSNLLANRVQKFADTSGTFVMRPDGTPGVANQVGYWQDANNLVSSANFMFNPGTNTLSVTNLTVVTNLTLSNLGLGVVHSSAAGLLSSSAVVLTSEVSGILPIANGGTNSSTALVGKQIMVSNSAGTAIVEAGVMTNGQLLIGSTGAQPVIANLSQGAFNSVTIANAAGSITLDTAQDIRTTASPSWVNVTLSGKTVGSVLFVGAAKQIQEDNPNFFWDDTNNRLGLGTATPARLLDVKGTSIYRDAWKLSFDAATSANYEMFQGQVNTTDATVTTVASVTVPTDSAVVIEAKMVGRRTGGSSGASGDAATYFRTARFKNVAGTVTMLTLQSDFTSEDQAAWDGTMDVSGTSARMRVKGASNNNVTWTVTYAVISLS